DAATDATSVQHITGGGGFICGWNELQQLGIGNGKQKRRRRRARAKAKREGFEAQCGLEEPTQMSRALGNNSDDDACEGGSTDAEASLSDTRCLTSAQIGNPWYGRVALAAGLALVGGSGTDTKGTDMVSAPDGPDWSKHRYCLDDRRMEVRYKCDFVMGWPFEIANPVALALRTRLAELAKTGLGADAARRWEELGNAKVLVPETTLPWGVLHFTGYTSLLQPLADKAGLAVGGLGGDSKAVEQEPHALALGAAKFGWAPESGGHLKKSC
ncbi:unnamed protein product, partial [Symbiodinium sp. KB8]